MMRGSNSACVVDESTTSKPASIALLNEQQLGGMAQTQADASGFTAPTWKKSETLSRPSNRGVHGVAAGVPFTERDDCIQRLLHNYLSEVGTLLHRS